MLDAILGFIMIAAVLLFPWSKNNYKIKHPTNNKHHAIIKIVKSNKKGKMSCTAFVIDNTRAITAGHCIKISDFFMKTQYKKLMKESYKIEKELKTKIEQLSQCPLPQCKVLILQAQMQLLAELNAREKAKHFKVDKFKVFNIYGEDTKIIATAAYNDLDGRDNGIIIGNFKNFEKLTIAREFNVKRNDKLKTCGYAGAKFPPICTEFIAIGNVQFMYYGRGLLIKGMSGGPAINADGEVVGINSSVPQTGVIIDTTIGMFNRKFKKPKK